MIGQLPIMPIMTEMIMDTIRRLMNREIGLGVYQVIWSGRWSRCETCTNCVVVPINIPVQLKRYVLFIYKDQ